MTPDFTVGLLLGLILAFTILALEDWMGRTGKKEG